MIIFWVGEMEDEFYVFVKLKTAWIEPSVISCQLSLGSDNGIPNKPFKKCGGGGEINLKSILNAQ